MNVGDVRAALAEALEGKGLRVYPSIPEAAQLPCAVVQWPEQITYNRDLRGGTEIEIIVTIAVPMNDWETAQARIDAALSTDGDGMAHLIHDHESGGAWRAAFVTTAGNVTRIKVASADALAADFSISIYA